VEVYLYSLLCRNGLRPSTESTVCVFFLVMKVVGGFTKGVSVSGKGRKSKFTVSMTVSLGREWLRLAS
jgi:hypothetical protein